MYALMTEVLVRSFRDVPAEQLGHLLQGLSRLHHEVLAPRELTLSTLKPANDGNGLIVRVLNPTDHELKAHLRLVQPTTSVTPVRLDETSP